MKTNPKSRKKLDPLFTVLIFKVVLKNGECAAQTHSHYYEKTA